MKDRIFKIHLDFHNQQIDLHGFNNKAIANSIQSQSKRFEAAARLFKNDNEFSLIDLGAGLCDFYTYLINNKFKLSDYTAVDINPRFINKSKELYTQINFINGSADEIISSGKNFDYMVASGIYNLGDNTTVNINFIKEQLTGIFPLLRKGMAINFLSSWTEKKDSLSIYYDPLLMLNLFKENFGTKVMLCHDYLPHDFTLIVYK